jgi:CBS domain containing-hemolysin-like protein
LLLSEILPKTLGAIFWKQLSTPSAWTLRFLILVLTPIVLPIEWIRGIFPDAEQEVVTRAELAAFVEVAEDESAIEEDEELVITNLLRLREIKVEEVMTPRVVLSCVHEMDDIKTIMRNNPIMVHGRLLVYGESLDDIKGIVLRNEILRHAAADDDDVMITKLMRPIHTCVGNSSVDEALDILLQSKQQLLLVKDDFGGTVGIVTMEDVIETLLGVEIIDEADREGIEEGVTGEDMREYAKQIAESTDITTEE